MIRSVHTFTFGDRVFALYRFPLGWYTVTIGVIR